MSAVEASAVGVLRIGTRASALAMVQARAVAEALHAVGVPAELTTIVTDGDRRSPDTPWGEGAFVAAIERALLDGTVDIAVHSAKDVPTDEDPRLRIAAFLPRAAPEDVLVVPDGAPRADLASLASGARVGTDSPRRSAFLRAIRPDLHVHPIHGNVDTRLRRLDSGETDALVLAAAGLTRLGLAARISAVVRPTDIPPAPGQGAIAVQVRTDDAATTALVARLDDETTARAVRIERALLSAAGGGCRAPLGALAVVNDVEVRVVAGVATLDGSIAVRTQATGPADATDDTTLVDALLRGLADRATERALELDRPRVVVARAPGDASAMRLALVDHGLAPVTVPCIEIEPAEVAAVDEALDALDDADWVVITSRHAVDALAGAAVRGGRPFAEVAREAGARWAAVGPSSARALRSAGIEVDVTPSAPTGLSLAEAIPITTGARVLVIRGDLADDRLPDRLSGRGATVTSMVVYRTREAPQTSLPLIVDALRRPPSAIVLTSPSTVRGWLALAAAAGVTAVARAIPCVAVGPSTAAEIRRLGLTVMAQAAAPDPANVATAVATAVHTPQELP